MVYFARQAVRCVGFLPARRKEVTRMEIHEWLELICSVGSFVLALIDHFGGKK